MTVVSLEKLLDRGRTYLSDFGRMRRLSTNQAAHRLGIATKTLSRYIAQGKVPAPQIIEVGGNTIHSWTEEEIGKLRALLPKIANGRKTRYQKLRAEKKKKGTKTQTKKKK